MKPISNKDLEQWLKEYGDFLAKNPERKPVFRTHSGIPIKPVYTSQDTQGLDEGRDLGFPCEYPFTRGVYPTMYRGRLWTKRLLMGLQTPQIFNQRQRQMLQAGQTGINFIHCNTYMRGYDSDEIEPELVGRCGTAIDILGDMELAFEGIPLDKVSTAFNDPGPFIMVAMYLALAEEQGIPFAQLRGTSNQSDFLSHFVGCNMMFRFSLEGHLRMTLDHIKFVTKQMPLWQPLSVVGQHIQQGGATPLQALAFTLASGIFYVDQSIRAGLEVDSFAPRFSFFFDVSSDFFEEIAKFRAARRMWARIMKERFGAKNPRSWMLRFHAQTSGTDLTQQQPLNNIVRATLQTLAAVLGGAQSIHTDSYDEAFWIPNEKARRLALMTNHILAEETGIADVIDPLGGAFYLESLTQEMESQAWQYIETVERMGGMMEAVKKGFVQREMTRSALEFQREVDKGQRVVVGANKYQLPEDEESTPPQEKVPLEHIEEHIARLRELKQSRSQLGVKQALEELRRVAERDGNLFAAVIEAVKAQATVGEMVRELRGVYGFGQPLLSL